MATSPNLDITNIVSSQSQKEVTANTAFDALDRAITDTHPVAFSDANVTLTDPEALENAFFSLTGSVTATRDLIVPTNIKFYFVKDETTGGDIRVKTSAGSGISMRAGDKLLLYCDGTNVIRILNPSNIVTDVNIKAEVMVVHRVDVADGATGDINVTIDDKIRVIDVWLVKTGAAGGASDTIQVKETANNITDAMSIDVADQTIVRAATIDDAEWEIPAAGTLRVTRTKISAANVACTVFVKGIRVL